jgi:hypothetical protein
LTNVYVQIFKKLFDEGLKIQTDRIQDLRKYARDQRDERAKKQRDHLQSIENLYPLQFTMLRDALNIKISGERCQICYMILDNIICEWLHIHKHYCTKSDNTHI